MPWSLQSADGVVGRTGTAGRSKTSASRVLRRAVTIQPRRGTGEGEGAMVVNIAVLREVVKRAWERQDGLEVSAISLS